MDLNGSVAISVAALILNTALELQQLAGWRSATAGEGFQPHEKGKKKDSFKPDFKFNSLSCGMNLCESNFAKLTKGQERITLNKQKKQ